jgi:hypothetical protein
VKTAKVAVEGAEAVVVVVVVVVAGLAGEDATLYMNQAVQGPFHLLVP